MMRILLADDRKKVRLALRLLLEQRRGSSVIGEAIDRDDLIVQAASGQPDLLLLDWDLPGLETSTPFPALRLVCPSLYVIALSSHPEVRPAALAAGADDFVSKADPPENLMRAIDLYADSVSRHPA